MSQPPGILPMFKEPLAAAARTVADKPAYTKRTCMEVGCTNGVVQGGLCVSHGAKRRTCKFPGCQKSSKSAGMCSRHGPRRKACDEEGCTSISVRGSKCKAHASPSNKCHVRGCRKAATNEGACMRHYTKSQSEANRASIPILGAASKNIQSIPQMCMPISSAGYASMMTSQAGLIGFPVMGVNVGLMPYMHPAAAASLLYNIQSNYLLGAPGAAPDFGALGEYHRNLIESRARAINNMTANTLAKLDSEKEKLI